MQRTLRPFTEGRRLEGRLSASRERRDSCSERSSSPARAFWWRPPRFPRRVLLELALLPVACSLSKSEKSGWQPPACGLVGTLMPCNG